MLPLETLYLSAITVAELRFGVASLPTGKRRDRLYESMENRVLPLFTGRVLTFDLPSVAGLHTADVAGARGTIGDRRRRRIHRRNGGREPDGGHNP